MMFKIIKLIHPVFLLLYIAIPVFIVSAIASWYEGSELLEYPGQWGYSTPFTNMFTDSIETKNDIIQLDFFIYAGQFKPFFPTILLISFIYIIIAIIFYFIQRNRKTID